MKSNFKILSTIFLSSILMLSSNVFSQALNINPNGNITPVQAVEDILIGAGIDAFNITYNGTAAAANINQAGVREFNAGTSGFPISSGVVMQTQGAPSVNNDSDLTALAGATVTNGSIIEFDFVPSGDTLSFNYIFASAEYTSFTCSGFNDVFGFFISGPGITGPYSNNSMNIATVPGTTVPVAINTVNNGTNPDSQGNCAAADPNWQSNSIYFTTSYNPIFTATNQVANFNGATVLLAANADLVCNDTFHIKLAVANAVDQGFDSGVFLEANSFQSSVVDINIQAGASVSDTTLVANCTEGTIYFTRPANQSNDTLVVYFETGGDAIEGVDYNNLAPGDSVVFYPGDDTLTLTITPTNGGPSNNPLELIVTAETITDCGDTIIAEGSIWLILEPDFETFAIDSTILCKNDEVDIWGHVTGGFPPYEYEWENGLTDTLIQVEVIGENGVYPFIFTATDQCGFISTDTAFITLNQTLAIDTMIQYPASCGENDGAVAGTLLNPPGASGTPNYLWTGPGANSSNFINASVWQNLPSGWYYFSISDNECTVKDSIFLEQDPPPTASFDATPNFGNAPLDVIFTNTTTGGGSLFEWDFGNGDGNTVNNMSSQNTTYIEPGLYIVTLTVSEGSCVDQATQEVLVNLVLPLTYDMPNVFTPNGDNMNDVFTINAENAVELEMIITNRWGNVVFESKNDLNPSWDGRDQRSGLDCTEGVYFYKFKVRGMDFELIEEHGFVHLIRDNK